MFFGDKDQPTLHILYNSFNSITILIVFFVNLTSCEVRQEINLLRVITCPLSAYTNPPAQSGTFISCKVLWAPPVTSHEIIVCLLNVLRIMSNYQYFIQLPVLIIYSLHFSGTVWSGTTSLSPTGKSDIIYKMIADLINYCLYLMLAAFSPDQF